VHEGRVTRRYGAGEMLIDCCLRHCVRHRQLRHRAAAAAAAATVDAEHHTLILRAGRSPIQRLMASLYILYFAVVSVEDMRASY